MADPKSTFRIRFGGSANSTIGSETRIYTDLVAHANSYANNFSANNLTISNANNILVSGNTLPDYIVSVAGEAGTGGGGTTVLVETESVPFNYNSNTTAKANGAVVNFIFEEHPGKTGEVLTNPFTITVSANNLILDPEGSFLAEGDTITFLSVIANLRLISNGTYWYLSGDNTLTTVAVSNNYLQTQLSDTGDVSNNYLTGIFTSNNYLQSQGYGTGDVSNNYLQAQGYLTTETGDVSNNYIQGRFTSNTYVSSNYVSNNFFQSQSSGLASPLSVNVYTSGSGNYTVPAGATFVYGFALGGGGGGGGNQNTTAMYGGGGGSGSGAYFSFSATAGSTIAYSVGSGGTGGGDVAGFGSTGGTGVTGGSTTFGSNVTAGGGVGGTGGTPSVGGTGGAGGTVSGSDVAFAKSGASGTDNPGDTSIVAGGAQQITFTPSAYIIYNQGDANTIGSSSILAPNNNDSAGGASSEDGQNGYLIVYAFG